MNPVTEAVWLCIALGVGGFLLSVAIMVAVLVRLPPTYFADGRISLFPGQPRWKRGAAHVAKNLVGVFLVVLGIVLSIPGVPGQGLLTILLGIILLDIPGKRRLEQKIVAIPAVRRSLNRLRERFGREPFHLEGDPS